MPDLSHVRHHYATTTPGDYVQNAAYFDAALRDHDAQVLRDASKAMDGDTAFYLVIEKRIVDGALLGVVDDVQDNVVAWLASRADATSSDGRSP